MNEQIRRSSKNELVRSFFGRIRGYQKVLSKLTDLYKLHFHDFVFDQKHSDLFKSSRKFRIHKYICSFGIDGWIRQKRYDYAQCSKLDMNEE